jgi:DNA-binding beta-propeller fold protein YncE
MVDAASRQLYLGRDEGVLAMNIDTKKITPVMLKGEGVHAALPIPGAKIVVTNGDTNKIAVFAADSGKLLGSLPAGEMPDAAVFEPKSGLVAVMNHRGGTVTLVDAKVPSVVATVNVGGELEFGAAAGDGRLFVNVADKGAIAVIDVAARKLLKSIKMNGCNDPSGLAYDAAADLLISVCGNGVTKFLHAADGKAVATLKTGAGSDGVMLDAERKVVFVPAGRDGTLAIISIADGKPTLVQSLKTQKSARLGALDTKTGNVYLPAGKLGPPVPPNPWPTVIPGTFEFLIVAKN